MGINFRKSQLEEKDLGIIVTKDLKPSVQCSKAAAKAMQDCRQVLRIIKRNFVLTDAEDFRLLFNGFVRPHLEYCVSVWSPYVTATADVSNVCHRACCPIGSGVFLKDCKAE